MSCFTSLRSNFCCLRSTLKVEPINDHTDDTQQIELILVGLDGVGKTNILERYVNNRFTPYILRTIGIDFKIATVEDKENKRRIKARIVDTSGQERFNVLTAVYVRDKQGVAFIYDITCRTSFEYIPTLVSLVESNCCNDKIHKVLIGNGVDKKENRAVSADEGCDMAKKYGMEFYEVSAKTGTGIDDCFNDFVLDSKKSLE